MTVGYRAKVVHDHRKGKPCYPCIEQLEIECGLRGKPQPPTGAGGGWTAPSEVMHTQNGESA